MTPYGSDSELTVWPGTRVQAPTYAVPEVRLIGDDTLVFGPPPDASDIRTVTLTPDFYLREFLEFDAGDPQQVLAFCREWGPVGERSCEDLHEYDRSAAQEADSELHEPWRNLVANPHSSSRPRIDLELGSQLGFGAFGMILQVHSVRRVAFYQAALANAVALWRFISGELTAEDLMENWWTDDVGTGSLPSSWLRDGDSWQYVATRPELSKAIFDLTHHLNPALLPFHVRLEPYVFGSDVRVNVYQAACLQLVNDIAERVPYRRCANERCGKLFTRQRDRGESDRYRSKGVRYCSSACARAQAQRAVRRRKRQS
jgi:hypothetical protein